MSSLKPLPLDLLDHFAPVHLDLKDLDLLRLLAGNWLQVILVALVVGLQEEASTLQAGTPRREAASIPEAASTPPVAAMRPTM